MKLSFNTYGNEKQKQAARAWADKDIIEVIYGGGKGGGKTYLGCKLIFGDALMYPNTRYFIARKELNDLRKYTLSSVQECFKDWGLDYNKYCTFNGQDNYFKLHNGSEVLFLSAKYLPSDPDYYRFGSMQMTRGWIEEAGELESAAKNNLQASVGRWMNKEYNLPPKLLLTCNPSKNFLYKVYKDSKAGMLPKHITFIQSLLDDNKMLDEAYKHNLMLSLTAEQTQRLVYGNWEFDDDPSTLIGYEAICDLFTNPKKDGDKCLISDLAMKGRDRFIAGIGNGNTLTIRIDKTFSPAREIEEDLKGIQESEGLGRSQVIADSDGLGQYLESYMNGIKEFHGNAKATDPKYANLRSQCYYKLAEMVNKRQIRIECTEEQKERIKDELGVIRALYLDDPEKKLRVIPKDDMKELLGHSPDYADTLMMWMWRYVSDSVQVFKNALFVDTIPEGFEYYGLKIGDNVNNYALVKVAKKDRLYVDTLIYSKFDRLSDFVDAIKLAIKANDVNILCHPSKETIQSINDLNTYNVLGLKFLLCKAFSGDESWRIDILNRNNVAFANKQELISEVDSLHYEVKDGKLTNNPDKIEQFAAIQAAGCAIQYDTSLR